MVRSPNVIAVIGAGDADENVLSSAREIGRRLAQAGCTVITGGLGGVMEAASQGASDAGGLVLGIVPGATRRDANPHVSAAIATGMGDARNAIIANTADAFIAVGGSYGTLSEIAFALKRNKRVVSLGSWGALGLHVTHAATPEEAVRLALTDSNRESP